MPEVGRLDGHILITSSDAQQGTLRTFRLNEELWIVTAWHPAPAPKDSWPAKIIRPPTGCIKMVKSAARHRYVLDRMAPTDVLLPDCPTGDHHGFVVRKLPKP